MCSALVLNEIYTPLKFHVQIYNIQIYCPNRFVTPERTPNLYPLRRGIINNYNLLIGVTLKTAPVKKKNHNENKGIHLPFFGHPFYIMLVDMAVIIPCMGCYII